MKAELRGKIKMLHSAERTKGAVFHDSAVSRTGSEQKRVTGKIPTWPTDTLMPSVTFVSIGGSEGDVSGAQRRENSSLKITKNLGGISGLMSFVKLGSRCSVPLLIRNVSESGVWQASRQHRVLSLVSHSWKAFPWKRFMQVISA